MGSEFSEQNRHAATSSRTYDRDGARSAGTPGKQTLVEQQTFDPHALALVQEIQKRAGLRVQDGGQFVYVIQPHGTFLIVSAPKNFTHSEHATIGFTHPAWPILAHMVLTDPRCLVVDEREPAPEAAKPAEPEVATPEPAKTAPAFVPTLRGEVDESTLGPNVVKSVGAKRDKQGNVVENYASYSLDRKSLGPLAVGDIGSLDAEHGATQVTHGHDKADLTKKRLECGAYVKVVALDGKLAFVKELSGPTATSGTDFGWIYASMILKLHRAAAKSASTQMSDLLAIARSAHSPGNGHGLCYAAVKNYIVLAGGYGNIADIRSDARFVNFSDHGSQFADAVAAIGATELGLEQTSGKLSEQQPGTLIVTRGNGKNGIDPVRGDIAVFDCANERVSTCYNDGVIPFTVAENDWKPGGRLYNSILGMYRPIDRK